MTISQLFKTAPVSTILLASFIGLYILQVLMGVDANNPTSEALISWGANFLPLTMIDAPWRLISSGFLHIGLMHLLFNGFAMYFFGQVAEPMFGSVKFLLLFLLSVIGGNLLNNQMTWLGILDGTGQPGLSAGASGGIMGIGAALLIAALFKISVNGMVLNLKSLVFIMGINLVYGFAVPGIDNAGHIGGAITGLLIALGVGFAHRQRLMTTLNSRLAASAPYQTEYVNYQADASTKKAIDDDSHSAENSIYNNIEARNSVNSYNNTDINAQFDNRYTADKHENIQSVIINEDKVKSRPAVIWQLLPWIMMVLIAIGFIGWWLVIHNQILQVLATQ